MALEVSPPPSTELSPLHQALSEKLDADIARVRAEIQSLTKRKQLLTSSLLSSSKVQSYLSARNISTEQDTLPVDLTPLRSQAQHNETNIHRLAVGVTSFPFTDPNPDTSDRPLLGVRFDIPSHTGRFEKAPYYIFFKRTREDETQQSNAVTNSVTENVNNDLKIHHHTIPALVPLQDYEAKYLPQTTSRPSHDRHGRDEGYFSPSPTNEHAQDHDMVNTDDTQRSQDLHALVACVRRDLMSWQLRTDAITLLSEQLGLSTPSTMSTNQPTESTAIPSYSLQSLSSTALDTRFCRLVWQNGIVGRIRITDDGYIDKAIVIDDQMERMKDVERLLCTDRDGGKLKIVDLLSRLEEVEKKVNHASDISENQNDDDGSMQVDD